MKIGVAGPGAVGSYYGARLARDGHDVYFLLRSDYEQVRRNGVRIISAEGNFNVRPRAARTPEEIGPCDLVLIALKTTVNSEFPKLIPPMVAENTAVLTLQNGLGNEEALARIFPPHQILGGLCFVCLNRTGPGVVEHIAHGKIEMGEFARWPEPRTHDIAGAFRHAGVPCTVRDNLEKAHWEKLVWNIPFNGLGVASCAGYDAVRSGRFSGRTADCLTTDKLLAEPKWLELVQELMREIIRTTNAFGLNIPFECADEQIEKTRVMGAYKPSTLVDFLRGQSIELESLFFEPLRRAEAKSVETPRLRSLCKVLQALDPGAAGS
ncbi:MAG TPA: 2-dehydropantoate 2-reductase [Verrucomicrobiae bacterium]|nr:2-dehydropantoate 2-reductase [Verrucomicrobiae bacterium]